MSTITRPPITVSRDLEFFSEPELSKQLGHSRNSWPLVLTGELIDNALDHTEEVKRLPFIAVDVCDQGITVRDNGAGMPQSVITGLIDFSSRTSSRVCCYRFWRHMTSQTNTTLLSWQPRVFPPERHKCSCNRHRVATR